MKFSWSHIDTTNKKQAEMLCVAQNQKNTIESVSESIAEAEKYTCWNPMLLKKDDEAIGFAMYGVWVDTNKPPRMWLDRFFIDQRYQKKGYAKQILPWILEQISVVYDEVYLSVYENNTVAIALYKQLGFCFNGETDTKGEKVMVWRNQNK